MTFLSTYPAISYFSILLSFAMLIPINAAAEQTNRLIHEQSPYLLQHAHNPVDWFPWGDEAFSAAQKEGKLIFLSIGYSTCHWCHVMEAESFTNEEVAAELKKNYIAIKVDREERPDIDQFYMQVGIELSGSGGWPLTIIMTPEKVPIFAGTYFPPKRRFNRPGLIDILPQIATAWEKDPAALLRGGKAVINTLQQRQNSSSTEKTLTVVQFKQAEAALQKSFEPIYGGFGEAPKFPRPHILSFLLQRYDRTANPELLQMVEKTLQAMRNGGIYDQIGFGFHRYSTDNEWLVPHFEKMLYDQAGLARVYLEAFQLTGKTEYRTTAEEIFNYVLRRLRDPKGGFYTAEDADSNGVEGEFYVWQTQEITALLGEERGKRFAQIFNALPTGNFSAYIPGEPAGTNILHREKSLSDWAEIFNLPVTELQQQLEEDRQKLFAAREQRIHPFLDDKVITAWNGQMISALALGSRVLHDPQLLKAAEASSRFIFSEMQTKTGQLLRRWRHGKAAINAFASDYAFLARGMLDLYQSNLDPDALKKALHLAEQLATHFTDQHGQLFETSTTSELPLRTNELYDGALPSSGSVTIEIYARLYLLTGDKIWNQRAEALVQASAAQVLRSPAGYTQFLLGTSLLLEPTRELVIVGNKNSPDTAALLAEVQPQYMPDLTLILRPIDHPELIDKLIPFIDGMGSINHQATAYLCQNFACQRPQTKPEQLRKLLKEE